MNALAVYRRSLGSLNVLTSSSRGQCRALASRASHPLRILFCGSDEFSSAALRAVHAEHRQDPQLIESIDVVIRPGKPTGRNKKFFREVPIKSVAEELGLRIHERDTFTGWTPPSVDGKCINLIIAVSFGLFVPPRLLRAAEYGGLNVHPSLLPEYVSAVDSTDKSLRGPAPLQHALLEGRTHTGITLQTLDPSTFDAGIILAQTPYPGMEIPASISTYPELVEFVSPAAAEMLVLGLRQRLFVPPLEDRRQHEVNGPLRHAPKLTSQDRYVDWTTWTAERMERYQRVLGRLWTRVNMGQGPPKRVILEDCQAVPVPANLQQPAGNSISLNYVDEAGATHRMPAVEGENGAAIILTADQNAVMIRELTGDSAGRQQAFRVLKRSSY